MNAPEPYTVVNHVVERRVGEREWHTASEANGELAGRRALAAWRASRDRIGGGALYRLVERTAVITDRVIDTDEEGTDEP